MDFRLTPEQELLVDTARAFVERELMPHESAVEQADAVAPELAARLRARAIDAGLYAANMPEALGGGGLGVFDLTLLERELGATGFALQMLVARPSNILRACQGEQIERYLLPTIRGERHDCLAMTEPGAGSDVRSMRTRAERDGDGWIINGGKHFISHADAADYVILFAATGVEDTPAGSKKRISAFLVDLDAPGVSVRPGPRCVSHRGYHQSELFFEGCRVSGRQLLGEEGRGFDLCNEWLGASRLTVAATCIGRARRALTLATEWAAQRRQFGQPIGRFQGIGFKLADMRLALDCAELLTLRTAWAADQGCARDEDYALAKLAATEALARIADEAIQIFGGMGLMDELPLERIWRDARVERIWDGTSEIQRHIVSRAMLRPLGA